MNLNTLSTNIELAIVNNEYGWGQNISYTHRRSTTSIPDIKAFCQDGHFKKIDEKDDTVEDGMSFLSVALEDKPERGDKITFAGSTWYVKEFTGQNPYDLFCVANMRHANTRSSRKQI